MRVIPPINITPAKLTSSTAAAQHDPSAYSAGVAYGVGDLVKVAADYAIYESLQDSNSGNTPNISTLWWRKIGPTEDAYNAGTTYAAGETVAYDYRCYESLQGSNTGNTPPIYPETQNDWWIDVGPVNRWAMFDLSRNTQTVVDGDIEVVFVPGQRIDSVGIAGLRANTATIEVTSVLGGGTVYGPTTYDLNSREVVDGYDFCFEPFGTLPSVAVFDVPPFSDCVVTITISSTSGNTKCGAVVVGINTYLGELQYQASNNALNFSTIERDIYGTATLVKRRSVPKTRNELIVSQEMATKLLLTRADLNAVPALWSGLDDSSSPFYEMTSILGIYTKFELNADGPTHVKVDLEIEEL